jgi:hypothetical protein
VPGGDAKSFSHAAGASAEPPAVATYQPSRPRKGLGRVLDWGLAKIERAFDHAVVADLISTFLERCDGMLVIMFRSAQELLFSYTSLRDVEAERLSVFDGEFKAVTKLRAAIDRRCLYASAGEERSLCVDKGIEINRKVKNLRARRRYAVDGVARYERMIAWCASYGNWLC